MPILSHTRTSNFPFRRRRASSPSAHPDPIHPLDTTSSSSAIIAAPANSLLTTYSKSSSPSSPNLSSPCDPPNPDESTSHPRRPFRHRSTHFEKFQAKMATVKLRSSTLNPTSSRTFSSGFSSLSPSSTRAHNASLQTSGRLPSPIGVRLSWETAQTELMSDPLDGSRCPSPVSHTQPLISPSCVSMIDHNSDSSSHLTLNSEPSSNKLSKSSPCVSNLPPQIELSLSFHSPKITGLPYSESSASPDLPVNTLPSQALPPVLDENSRALKSTVDPVNDQLNFRGVACSPPVQPAPKSSNETNGALTAINHCDHRVSSLTSRVRPTPSPRPNLSLNHDLAASVSSSLPTARPSGVPVRLSHLPRLNSYVVPSNDGREPSESSSSNELIDSVEDEVVDEEQDVSGQSDGISDDDDDEVESSHHHGDQTAMPPPLPSLFQQPPSFPDPWMSRETTTPTSKPFNVPVQLPSSTSTTRSQDQNVATTIISSPGHRARCLLLSPTSPTPNKPSLHPRPSTDSRRSHSAVDLSHIGPSASSVSNLKAANHSEGVPQSGLFGAPHLLDQNAQVTPTIVVGPTNALSSQAVKPAVVSRNTTSSDHSTAITQRHQSMYEFRPPTNLPSYDSHRPLSTPTIVPREEEGRERLPPYSCAIHLEGWMPRKMEFKSPGVQAKDRSWKRQYVILHGTMIRIYRSDPHAHPLSGSSDPYSSNFIHSRSSSLFASTCGIDTKRSSQAPPLHFHHGKYDSVPVSSLKEAALVKAVHQNSVQRVYTLQNAESGLAADYVKRKYVVRVRAEGEQFLLQAKNDRGVIDLIEALQAATNVSLDLDVRPLPKFITLPRRRRRRRVAATRSDSIRMDGAARREIGSAVVEGMIAEAEATRSTRRREMGWTEENGDRMADMLAEEQEAYMQSRN